MRIRLFHRTIVVELTVAFNCCGPHATQSFKTVSKDNLKLKLLYNCTNLQFIFLLHEAIYCCVHRQLE